jgi:hypothetical protein
MKLKSLLFSAPRSQERLQVRIRRRLHVALSLGLTLAIFLPSLTLTVSAHATTSGSTNDYFLLTQAENGDVVCRTANLSERGELQKISPKNLRQINHLEGKSPGLGAEADNAVSHLTIILRATQNLDANGPAKAAYLRAVASWEGLVNSPITIYIDADFGPDNFGQAWPTGVLGSTSSPSLTASYSVVRQNLIAGANTQTKSDVYNALPANSVPTDTGSGSSLSTSVSASIARAIGLLDATAQDTESAARMSFNSTRNFDFDRSDGVTGLDFESVVTHEIGHALGFTSQSGSGSATPALWDLYRFRSGTTAGTFTNATRIMTLGGPTANSQYFFFPGQGELGLSDGGPNGASTNNADGNQSSHWRQAILVNGDPITGYIGIMDPRIPNNITRLITDNDIAALNIFGYNSNALPAPANDNFAAAQLVTGCSGSVNGSNVGGNREPGEDIHSPDGVSSHRSVWYEWVAPATGSATITTAGSNFDTVLGVYTGSSVAGTTSLGKSDDNSGTDKTSTVIFDATAGTIYHIAVDGYNNSGLGGDAGSVTLNWSEAGCTAPPPITLTFDQTGPAADQASALDSILMVRDPFLVINPGNVINPNADRNTRIIVFVADLQLQAGAPALVTINLVDGNNQTFNIAALDYRAVPNQALTQITFRLPDNLAAGTCTIKVGTPNQISNAATFRIQPN